MRSMEGTGGGGKPVSFALTENPVSDYAAAERIELFKVMEEEMHRHYGSGSHGK